ncbi:MAG: hypothetical protein IJZ37_04520, partial [Clostridia bacterium]|nr:hypothetical protein [Clostridia bacterium]
LSILISDLLTDSDWMGAVDRMLYQGRQVYLIQILSRNEITPSMSGKVLMLDSESVDEEDDKNMRYEITRSSVKAYEQALLYHQKQIKDFCGARGVGFITLCSDLPLEQMLFINATEVGLIQ